MRRRKYPPKRLETLGFILLAFHGGVTAAPLPAVSLDPPAMVCRPLPAMEASDWNSVGKAFAQASPISLDQTWLEKKESRFRKGAVRTAWTKETLWVYAELEDEDIFNPAPPRTEDFFLNGDVFEIFLRPAFEEPYMEIHFGPSGQQLQIRWPALGMANEIRSLPAEWPAGILIRAPVFRVRVRAQPDLRRWEILAEIPSRAVAKTGVISPGDVWFFSFSRYDFSRGEASPVLSSTSPHESADFHRLWEWGTLRFMGE